jgi:pyrimidine operon attenuation protein/uracil phosphoribosyltransferase
MAGFFCNFHRLEDVRMQFKAEIMDESAVERSLLRITHEIIERNHGTDGVVLLGIKRRGVPLAKKIAENIKKFEGVDVPVGYIDITLYRDDLSEQTEMPSASDTNIPCEITGKRVVIVDDVIYTGRTVRAAIEGVFEIGRPAYIQLAVLVDRGHRELPIRPDFVGKNIPTSRTEVVAVCVPEFDGFTGVRLYDTSVKGKK